MLKKTPLYDLHLELGARMTPFAGYSMPIQYAKGMLHEHRHCRSQAGFFDISHMGQCEIIGRQAVHEIESLVPSDITALSCNRQRYSVLTNPEGGIIDDIIITRTASGLTIIVNAACKDKDFEHIQNHLSKDCRFVERTDRALLALQGPAAASIMQKLCVKASELSFMQALETNIKGIPCDISRSGYTGEDGFEISVGHQDAETMARLFLAEEAVEPIGLAARDSLRLEAGLCLYGHEIDETITPVEAGLQWLIKQEHFPGSDKILAQLQKGPEKMRAGLLIDGKIPVREGAEIYDNHGVKVGHVSSGGFSPSLGCPIAMALLDKNIAILGNELYAKVRDHSIHLKVTALPFIPHRYRR